MPSTDVRWRAFPTSLLGGCLSTSLPRDAAHDALHLIGAFFLNGRGHVGACRRLMLSADVRRGVRFDVPASRAFDGMCGDVPPHTPPRWLSQHLLPNHDAALCCVDVYVHSLCRAAGVLESQESG